MKMSVRLTMQGLIRALQGRAHGLAEEVERGGKRGDARRPKPEPREGGKHASGRR